jgi:hypothetical protein
MSGPKKILHLCPSLLIEFIGTYRCLPHMIELIVTGCRAREVILELLECCLLVKASKHFEELKIFRLSMLWSNSGRLKNRLGIVFTTFDGADNLLNCLYLFKLASVPHLERRNTRIFLEYAPNTHFSIFRQTPNIWRFMKVCTRFSRWSPSSLVLWQCCQCMLMLTEIWSIHECARTHRMQRSSSAVLLRRPVRPVLQTC